MAGRLRNSGSESLSFKLKRSGTRFLAVCGFCNNELANTSSKRLQMPSETCGSKRCYQELSQHIHKEHPEVSVRGRIGRRGSFEVMVNGKLVHSKLSSLTLPDYNDLCNVIKDAKEGKEVRSCKQQNDCVII